MKEYNEELYNWLVEDLWGSFAYNSPEEHARCILNYIYDKVSTNMDEQTYDDEVYKSG